MWCTVSAVLDRAVFLFQSAKDRLLSVKRTTLKSSIVVILLAIMSLVVYINISLLYGVVRIGPEMSICTTLPTREVMQVVKALSQADAIINLALPYGVIFITSVWGLKQLCVLQKNRDSMIAVENLQNGSTPRQRATQEDIHTTRMVSISSMFFLFFNLPGHLLRLYTSLSAEEHAHDWINQTLLFLCQQCLFYLFTTRAAMNFFFYLINPLFRKELICLFSKVLFCDALKPYRRSLDYHIYSLPFYTTNLRSRQRRNTWL